jgi:hypothetical protein
MDAVILSAAKDLMQCNAIIMMLPPLFSQMLLVANRIEGFDKTRCRPVSIADSTAIQYNSARSTQIF